jgi:hypothetical protein
MTTKKPTDILPKRSRLRMHRSNHSNDCHREAVTGTIPNAESKDAEICIWNVQSGFPRAEVRSYHGGYDHLL